MLISGGFGAGKSHVLEHLAHLGARGRLRRVQGRHLQGDRPARPGEGVRGGDRRCRSCPASPGSAIDEIATGLLTDSAEYAALYRWVHSDDVPVDSRFAASLFLFEYARGDAEFADRIVRFWAGDPLPVADLRRRLKEAGAAATYRLAAAKERDLAVQRFRFVSRLITAAGYRGWVAAARRGRADRPLLAAATGQVLRRGGPLGARRPRRSGRADRRRADDRRRLRGAGARRQERPRADPEAAAHEGPPRTSCWRRWPRPACG